MKKDMDNTAYVRHYKVKEEPKLGNTVSYVENLSGESISATTNDGVVIRKIATYIDEKENNKEGKPTLFTGEWNDVTVKPTEKGYITFWLDNEWETTNPPKLKTPIQLPIRIANTSKENEKDYLEPLIVEKEQKIEVLIPDGIYRNTNNNDASGTLTIRYSLVKDEITDLKKLSRVGEVEEYKVRVMPPVEARFLSPLDYGVKLNESADEHGGEGRGILDNIISMREMFDERVQFRNLHNKTIKPQYIQSGSNVAILVNDYYSKGIDVQFEEKTLDPNRIEEPKSSRNTTLLMNLTLEKEKETIIRIKRQVDDNLESNLYHSDYRVYDNIAIGSIGYSSGYHVNSISHWNETKGFNNVDVNLKGIDTGHGYDAHSDSIKPVYNIMARDYENDYTYHDYKYFHGPEPSQDFYNEPNTGARGYMVKTQAQKDKYTGLGESIKAEKYPKHHNKNSWDTTDMKDTR